MEAPDIFKNIDPSKISRNKADETLLYVRYLLTREQDPAKMEVYQNFKLILETRIAELDAGVLPVVTLPGTVSPVIEPAADLSMEGAETELA
jgi:hypothetical protein